MGRLLLLLCMCSGYMFAYNLKVTNKTQHLAQATIKYKNHVTGVKGAMSLNVKPGESKVQVFNEEANWRYCYQEVIITLNRPDFDEQANKAALDLGEGLTCEHMEVEVSVDEDKNVTLDKTSYHEPF